MKASVEAAIRSSIRPGEVLPTPTGTATFVVDKMDAEGLSLLFGPKMTRTFLTWLCLEGVPGYLRGQGWVLVGANRDVNGNYGLDGYLKRWIKRQTANYVAVVLERAGILELTGSAPPRSGSLIADHPWAGRTHPNGDLRAVSRRIRAVVGKFGDPGAEAGLA